MKIVHIGKGTVPDEIKHIVGMREASHEVYVPGEGTHEQLVRRIIDADEIHIWDAGMVFELGMVYFYSVHALHRDLNWEIKVFCDPNPNLPVFQQFRPEPEPEPACPDNADCVRCSDCAKKELAAQGYLDIENEEKSRPWPCEIGTGEGGEQAGYCALCGDKGWIDKIKHADGCPLHDPGVTHVRMTAVAARVVLSGEAGMYWWRGPSLTQYGISRYNDHFIMRECVNGNAIHEGRLRDIRKYIVDNQGAL